MLKYQLYAVVEMACTADTLALHTFIWTNLFATSKCSNGNDDVCITNYTEVSKAVRPPLH